MRYRKRNESLVGRDMPKDVYFAAVDFFLNNIMPSEGQSTEWCS